MNMQFHNQYIQQDPEIMAGQPVFTGTRIPVSILFGYLAAGEPLSEFFENYPSVKSEHVFSILGDMQHQFTAPVMH